MNDPNIHDAMKAISKMIQNSEAVSFSHDLPLPVKKAWLAHLQFVIAGAKAFAEENGIHITEEES